MALTADTKRNPEQKLITNVHDFLVLSGLPMYTDILIANGCTSLNSLASMNTEKLRAAGISDSLHLEILVSAITSTWNVDSMAASPANSHVTGNPPLVHQV